MVLALGGDHRGAGRALRADAARSQAAARLHTVENIGIIFIGLGLALAFQRQRHALRPRRWRSPRRCSTCFNHSLFKSLLFFGAGAVLTATGERDMEHLGGLIHRMPQTAFAFLVGCVAISALPPLNGFVSEWLTFQAILLSPELPQWGLKFLVPAVGALLALSAALAAACFVRAFGVTFLGRPRTPAAAERAARPIASRSPRCSSSRRSACSPASCPASSSTRWRRSRSALRRRAHAGADRRCPGSRSCRSPRAAAPTTACSCSCSSPSRPRSPPLAIHRLASRRAAARAGLGLRLSRSEPGHAIHRRQLRPADPARVRHARVSRARACRDAAARRHAAGAASRSSSRDLVWDALYAPIAGAVGVRRRPAQPPAVPDHPPLSQPRLRRARRSCSWCSRYGPDRSISSCRARRCSLVLLLAPLLTGFVRKVKARLLRRQGPPLLQPYRDLAAAAAQGGGAGRERLLAVPRRALSHLRRHLGRGGAGADLRHRPAVQLVGRPHRHRRAARQRALLPGARRAWTSAPASAASARAAR